jgi:hypothetical protein
MLAEAVAAAVPAASHMEPRAAQKAVRLNAKTKTEVSEKSKSAFKKSQDLALDGPRLFRDIVREVRGKGGWQPPAA